MLVCIPDVHAVAIYTPSSQLLPAEFEMIERCSEAILRISTIREAALEAAEKRPDATPFPQGPQAKFPQAAAAQLQHRSWSEKVCTGTRRFSEQVGASNSALSPRQQQQSLRFECCASRDSLAVTVSSGRTIEAPLNQVSGAAVHLPAAHGAPSFPERSSSGASNLFLIYVHCVSHSILYRQRNCRVL